MDVTERRVLRWSVSAVWLGTAALSVAGWNGAGRGILAAGGVGDAAIQNLCMGLGIGCDVAIGAWMLWAPSRRAYACAMAAMGVMTVIGGALDPSLLWDPLGRMLKNVAIAAALWVLWRDAGKWEAGS